jgi:hypothetical protein
MTRPMSLGSAHCLHLIPIGMELSLVEGLSGDTMLTWCERVQQLIYPCVENPHHNLSAALTMGDRNTNHQKIVNVLSEAKIPMDVENIRLKTGLKNWESTKSILLELVIQGTIFGQKTTRGWIFWLNGASMRGRRRGP